MREGKQRIRAAAAHLGLHVPGLRITVNLAPADVRKDGAAFDLPLLVGILTAWGERPADRCRQWATMGELGLDGSVRAVRGALPVALHAREKGDVKGLILPREIPHRIQHGRRINRRPDRRTRPRDTRPGGCLVRLPGRLTVRVSHLRSSPHGVRHPVPGRPAPSASQRESSLRIAEWKAGGLLYWGKWAEAGTDSTMTPASRRRGR